MITKALFSKMLNSAAENIINQSDYLSELDARFGDGDHGVTMKKIALLMQTSLNQWQDQPFKQFFDDLGTAIMAIGGGSAGPLWGTLIGGLAIPLPEDCTEINADMFKGMLVSALEEMQTISPARVGDKTMMDTFIPAVETAWKTSGDIPDILNAAALAAQQGAKSTEALAAKFGRAKNYREQSIGTPDAGATSLMFFFEGLAAGIS